MTVKNFQEQTVEFLEVRKKDSCLLGISQENIAEFLELPGKYICGSGVSGIFRKKKGDYRELAGQTD